MSTTTPNPLPDSYRRVTPCLVVQGAAKALEFYAEVFGATERMHHVLLCPFCSGHDEAAIFEDAKVLGHCRPADRQVLGQLPDRARVPGQ
jgi:hypothetical protein